MARKEAAVTAFIHDAAIDVYNDGRQSGNLPLETLDTSEFEADRYVEGTAQNFADAMFDPNSGKDITKEYCMLIGDNGEILCVNRGDEHSCGFTQQQISQYGDGATVIHSHPPVALKGDAGTFSGTDISSMGIGENSQVIAAPEGQYIMEFPPGADIQGFKREIADSQAKVNAKLVKIRIDSAKEWFAKGQTDAERDMTRADAMRTCINKQKMAWSGFIEDTAKKHGIVYRFYSDQDTLRGKKPGYKPNSALVLYGTSMDDKLGLFRNSRFKSRVMTDSSGSDFGYFTSKKGASFCIDMESNDIIYTGKAADDHAEKSTIKTWISILRRK